MKHEVLFAGFGGQGVLSMGMTLAYAGMSDQKEVSWMPSYGPEMRGGTANCIVIVSDKNISSPIVTRFDTVVALNQPSIDKFEKAVKPGGSMLYDKNNTLRPPTRTDITCLCVPVEEEAAKLGNQKVKNMILLGAFLQMNEVVSNDSILKALSEILPERYHHLIPLNQQALEIGRQLVREEEVTI